MSDFGSRYVLATANPGKIKEMQMILSGLGIELVTRADLGINMEIEETGATFFENARLKAKAICKVSGLPSIADDSGLIVDALDGRPGVYASSLGGVELTAEERCRYLLGLMENMEQREAKFVCTIVCVFPDGKLISADGSCSGTITTALKGSGGFGYDPVFLVTGTGKSMAELSLEEKNAVSHRGVAIRELVSLLEKRGKI